MKVCNLSVTCLNPLKLNIGPQMKRVLINANLKKVGVTFPLSQLFFFFKNDIKKIHHTK